MLRLIRHARERFVASVSPRVRRLAARTRMAIDVPALEALQERHRAMAVRPVGPFKYFDLATYLRMNARRAVRLGLDRATPRRILDLGSGFGWFAVVCRELGHEVVGLDVVTPGSDGSDLYTDVIELLGVRRVAHRIEAGVALPEELAGPFDLVTAFQIVFGKTWSVGDWRGLLADLRPRLAPSGRLHLEFNAPKGQARAFGDDVAALFASAGASFADYVGWHIVHVPEAAKLPAADGR